MSSPNPATTEWVPIWNPTSPGIVTGPPVSTSDAVVLFDGPTGKVLKDSLVLISNVARRDVPNTFVGTQIVGGLTSSGDLVINKDQPTVQLTHIGSTQKARVVQHVAGYAVLSSNLRYDGVTGFTLDDPSTAGSWYQLGSGGYGWYLMTAGAAPRPATDLMTLNATALTVNANVITTGSITATGAIYPGRVDTPGSQSAWYLASHAAYGLYSNTGLFLGGLLSVASTINAAGAITSGGTIQANGNLVAIGNIHSQGQIYPGRIDTAGQQASWYLGSHASYGLYSNTGLRMEGNLSVAAGVGVGGSLSVAGNIICSGLLQGIQAPRLLQAGGATGVQVDLNVHDYVTVDSAAGSVSFYAPLNPREGMSLILRVRDTGGATPLYWDAHFITGCATAIPTVTVAPAKTMHMAFRYSAQYDRWFMLALSVEP